MRKTCTKCGIQKDNSEFRTRNKEKGTVSAWCRICFSEYEKIKYESQTEDKKVKRKISRSKTLFKKRKIIWDYLLKHPCVDCGLLNPILCEFDHKDPAAKIAEILPSLSIDNLMKEIDKCDVRCVACHRLRTCVQFNWYAEILDRDKYLSLTFKNLDGV